MEKYGIPGNRQNKLQNQKTFFLLSIHSNGDETKRSI